MGYKIAISELAEKNFRQYLEYVTYNLENFQATLAILDDWEKTISSLRSVATNLKIVNDPELSKLGYRVKHFKHHRLLVVYRVENDVIYVDAIYHVLQDYENLFKSELDGG